MLAGTSYDAVYWSSNSGLQLGWADDRRDARSGAGFAWGAGDWYLQRLGFEVLADGYAWYAKHVAFQDRGGTEANRWAIRYFAGGRWVVTILTTPSVAASPLWVTTTQTTQMTFPGGLTPESAEAVVADPQAVTTSAWGDETVIAP